MRKHILLAFITLTVFNCGDEVEFNTPFFQGDRQNQLWKAEAFSASIDIDGFLTITGTNITETVNLKVPSVVETSQDSPFEVGDVNTIEAQYINTEGKLYTTNFRPDESISIYPELGKIWIDEIDVINRTFTGRFRFLAFDASRLNSVGYSNGTFYKIPLTSGTIPTDPITCQDTQEDAEIARLEYEATFDSSLAFINSVNFEAACNTYIATLNNQRAYCGDVDGSIQAIIDGLNCTYTCDMAVANVTEAFSQFENSTMGNYIALCNQYAQYLQEQITYCGNDDGSVQIIINSLQCGDDDDDTVPNIYEDFNSNGNLDDDDSDNDLNADYLDDDDDDDGVLTINEVQFDTDGNPTDTDGDGMADYFDTDDDGDGINTIDEDINGDGNPANDDTDGDGIPNYLDMDDDDDGVFTIFEDVNSNGNPTDDDTDGDIIPNYLDIDDDGDSVFTIYELFEMVVDGNPNDTQNFDNDTVPDYLDNDDDNDGILTINENPDPNGDGNPSDATNTDADMFPDYLDA